MTQDTVLTNTSTDLLATLRPADRAMVSLNSFESEKDLKELAKQYIDVVEIKDQTDYNLVKRATIAFMRARTGITNLSKQVVADARAFQKAVKTEEGRLVQIIAKEESRLKTLRKDYEDKLKRERKEKEEKEAARVAKIREKLKHVRVTITDSLTATAHDIQTAIDYLSEQDLKQFEEFADEAESMLNRGVDTLKQALEMRLALDRREAELKRQAEEQEAERKRQAEERAEIERQRAKLEEAEKASARVREAAISAPQDEEDGPDLRRPAEGEADEAETWRQSEGEAVGVKITLDDAMGDAHQSADALATDVEQLDNGAVIITGDLVDAELSETQQAFLSAHTMADALSSWKWNSTGNDVIDSLIRSSIIRVNTAGKELNQSLDTYAAKLAQSESAD